ncbi:cutinase family protein [Paractinoplanes globisporus]|uniref:Cutinase family protein n=1 Tax=Paractinoplanes globisporus TaxID=113565 RepID=A0ABW6WV85_9ACTN|nr:cutinase family protein [Actinoplanes globisporus]
MTRVVRSALAAVTALLCLGASTCYPTAASAVATLPATCGAATLFGGTAGHPAQRTQPDDGTYVPVLLVHGFLSGPDTWQRPLNKSTTTGGATQTTESFAGLLQSIPGVAVYTVDYSATSNKWMATADGGGPRLLQSLTCILAADAFAGRKAVIIGHSMGGLAARWALGRLDPAAVARIGQVITVGTPHTGATLADTWRSLASSGQTAGEAIDVLRLLALYQQALALCLSSGDLKYCIELALPGDATSGLTKFARTSQMLSTGSPGYTELAPWPAGVSVREFAASIELTETAGAFTAPTTARTTEIGDGVVALDSQIAAAGPNKVYLCRYNTRLEFFRDFGAVTRYSLAGTSDAGQVFGSLFLPVVGTSPCAHTNETALWELAVGVKDAVLAVMASMDGTGPPGDGRVKTLPVAGALVAGTTLGPDGSVWVLTIDQQGGSAQVEIIDPKTYAITVHQLGYRPADGGTVSYVVPRNVALYGPAGMAFGDDGRLWVMAVVRSADGATARNVLLRYSTTDWQAETSPVADACATATETSPVRLNRATDGAIWVTCPQRAAGGVGTHIERHTDGTITAARIVLRGRPGDLLYAGSQNLKLAVLDEPLTPAPGGVMWMRNSGSLIEFRPDGQELLHLLPAAGVAQPGRPVPTGETHVVGDGAHGIVLLSACLLVDTVGGPTYSKQCLVDVDPAGDARTIRSVLPDYNGYNRYQVSSPTMDSDGNVWVYMLGKANGDAPGGRYYVKSAPGGAMTVHPFTAPSPTGKSDQVTFSKAAPVVTADGALWVDALDSTEPVIVRVLPAT